ncbi:ATP-binding protein [Petroclostridium sp. X23]|uniref:ATP-binding protein n=1 Tax=Petroclostridium sp. X23 TaxID=3045146 RepID=UPI0024AC9B2C|nr:ATP-binding protein [Petroclostridium sp. X23]WHH59521.1 ATP-binding protein [Petroclostridium sp. X23]
MFQSLRSKILSIYIFLILLICSIAAVSVLSLYNLNRAIDGLIESNYRSIVAATNMINAMERQDSNQLIFLQVNEEKGRSAFTNNEKEFFIWLGKAKDNITEEDEAEILDKIEMNYIKYLKYFSKLQQIKASGRERDAIAFYDNEIYPVFHSVKDACMGLSDLNERAMFRSKEKATVSSRNQMYSIIAFSLFLISFGLFVALYFINKTMKPMHMLISGVKSIKEGNLNQEIQISTQDEIGQLASEFNNMTKRLWQYEQSNIKSLIAERNKSLAIVKSISDPIIVTDNQYQVTLVNKAAETVFDISEQKVTGKHFLEVISNNSIFDEIKRITDGNEFANASNNLVTIIKKEKKYFYLLAVTSILNNDNQTIGTVSVLQDITHMKEVEDLKSNFISTVSHELRTPLTSIIMGAGLLLDGISGELNPGQKEIVEAMDEDGTRLMAIVNDLLDLSKIESGKMYMNLQQTSIYALVESCINPLLDIAKEKGIRLFDLVSKDIPLIYLDSNKISYVMNNLITNALKFTDRGGEIKISAKVENQLLKVSVKDTGIGIPKEYHELIFEKFTQVESESKNQGGTGLGLAITKEFIKKHNGDIWVESEPGEGSNFIFTLPLDRG